MIRTDIEQAPITKDFIKQFLPENPIIVEAGAHIGRDTLKMSTLWPQSTIYAFEPVPELSSQLIERTKEQPNVHCFQLALSNHNGTALFNVSSGATTAASSLLEPHEYLQQRPNVIFTQTTVETITLDTWAEQYSIKSIDFLWLDMQGHELTALAGASHIFTTVKAVLIEASLTERFKGNPLYNDVLIWFEKKGFSALRQDVPKHNKINLFFIKKIIHA